jgi:ATP-dependent protease ClpP protease subunit
MSQYIVGQINDNTKKKHIWRHINIYISYPSKDINLYIKNLYMKF